MCDVRGVAYGDAVCVCTVCLTRSCVLFVSTSPLRSPGLAMGLSPGCFSILAVLAAVIGFILASAPSHEPSPLLHAAFKGDLDAVQRLLPVEAPSASASPASKESARAFAAHIKREANARDQWNNTALHVSEARVVQGHATLLGARRLMLVLLRRALFVCSGRLKAAAHAVWRWPRISWRPAPM